MTDMSMEQMALEWLMLKEAERNATERRRALIDALAHEIHTARGVDPRAPLSPQATSAAAAAASLPAWPLLRLPWWLVPSAAVLAVAAMWLTAALLASSRAAELAAAAGGAR